jgi:carboxylesterase type B
VLIIVASLFVDVYVPNTATPSSKLPVKVWIYGGSNEAGSISDATYNGCFAAANTIVVSVNYRVGPLGWLALPDLGISGNFGTQDQLLALAWVQANIASFGGDPARVLLFGQSAGADDSFVLATLPQALKLIYAAALESGSGRTVATVQQVTPWNRQFVRKAGCSDLACIRAVSLEKLNETEFNFNGSSSTSTNSVPGAETLLQNAGKGDTWGPTVDGAVIPVQPLAAGLRVPAIVGSNSQEGTLFVLGTYHARAFSLNESDYEAFLSYNFGRAASDVNATYPLSKFGSAGSFPPPAFAAISAVITAYAYKCPAHRALRTGLKNGVGVFAYSFNHTPSCSWYQDIPANKAIINLLGATHTAEIPFVFNMTKNLPPPGGNCSFSSAEDQIADFMLGAWDSMATSGKPGDSNSWPAWTEGEGEGLVVGDSVSVGKLDYSACEFWDQIDDKVASLAGVNGTATGGSGSGTPTPSGNGSIPVNSGGKLKAGFWLLSGAMLATNGVWAWV